MIAAIGSIQISRLIQPTLHGWLAAYRTGHLLCPTPLRHMFKSICYLLYQTGSESRKCLPQKFLTTGRNRVIGSSGDRIIG
jgi:hypothetical protein